jgi:hypothetical protein
MKIRFLSGPRTGQTDHAPNSQEMQLLAKAGIIEIIPYQDFRARLREEASPAAVAPENSWGVKESNGSAFSQPTIIKKVGCETFYLKEPDETTPPAIVEKFHVLKNSDPGAARAAVEAAKRQQEERERAERTRVRSLVVAGK